jgi:simple sugar transport system ATP-binding protein
VRLGISGLSKRFGRVLALDRVDFTLAEGEIHALMGENGAGKSTLIKTLTGFHSRDAGEILVDGVPVDPRSPREAEALGISTVYQEVNLIPHLSVGENICLGREPVRFMRIRRRETERRAAAALTRVGLTIDPRRVLASCPLAVRQMVAIARALDVDARILVLDEPTSSLDPREVKDLFSLLRRLRSEGKSILFVTHFLDQVYEVADRVTVLRDGRLAGVFGIGDLPRVKLIACMLGKDLASAAALGRSREAEYPEGRGGCLLEVERLGRRGSIAPVDLELAEGEALGLAGLLGSGRTELCRLLFGIDRPDGGRIRIQGEEVRPGSPRDAIRKGMAMIPEDRKDAGILPDLSVRENILLAVQARRGVFGVLTAKRRLELANRLVASLGIRAPDLDRPVSELSGGNQQKVVLARWLANNPRVLILDEPTRGIDVGSRAEIEALIASLRRQGISIVLVSSELEEIVRICARVTVLRDRRAVGELSGRGVSVRAIMEVVAGSEGDG